MGLDIHQPLARAFGDLKVRPKLMVLHNLFFLVLACAAYFALIPLFQNQVEAARSREVALVRSIFTSDSALGDLSGTYDLREGGPEVVPDPKVRAALDADPGRVLADPSDPARLYRKHPYTGRYRTAHVPDAPYTQLLRRAQWTLFVMLGAVYLLAVLVLEWLIMPLYVYRPLRLLLDADRAMQRGDRDHEIIPEEQILGDEIGQIMRARNEAIAELRRHEDHLEAALRKLEEQDRLASLGLLSASVAHELNTPLAVLHGSIEKLRETETNAVTLERLSRMERVTQRLRRISETLVDFARQRKQEMEPVALRPLVDEAWGLVAIDEHASAVGFRNEVGESDEIIGNADRLVQVFVNLLRNALNAVKSCGSMSRGEIRVGSRRLTWNGQPWIAVTVEDNGPGIASELLPDIFEAFVTTQLDARGTGLGLTVAEGIVTQHGGTISAANRAGGGACLEVRFPARAAAAAGAPASAADRPV
jgi:signal transduction histidine kinase